MYKIETKEAVDEAKVAEARVVGFNMPFWSIVIMILKITLAAIPVVIVLTVVWWFMLGLLMGIAASLRTL